MSFIPDKKANEIRLTCNRCFDPEAEERFSYNPKLPLLRQIVALHAWCKNREWESKRICGRHFDHKCPSCVRLSKVPESYIKWAVAS